MNKQRIDIQGVLDNIGEWLFNNTNKEGEFRLEIGLWDYSEPSFYATIVDKDGSPLYGENSYGSETVIEAIAECYESMTQEKQP